ncbi:hypothetical protein [Mesobacillus jeotgali]|uniref:hypothetical protein n=1 Tax=Mesobacillus jeotgali TaxID=129985 RepID=UPI0009A80869|nr:hypothetical protein [Mesobacillus jeotgali]
MREDMNYFSNVIGEKTHILQLIKKLDLCLKLQMEQEVEYLSFKGGNVEPLNSNIHSQFQITIRGNAEYLAQLFRGECKLRQGVRWGYFTIEDAPFRDLLLLESIFYLARPISA